MARLLIKVPGRSRTQRVYLKRDRQYSVGSSSECDIVVHGEGVAPRHFRLEYRHGRYLLVRQPKGPGVYVRHEKVRRVLLRNGDAVRFGRAEAVFRDRTAPKVEDLKDDPDWTGRRSRRSKRDQAEEPIPDSGVRAFDRSELSWYGEMKEEVRRQRRAARDRMRRKRRQADQADQVPKPRRWNRWPTRVALFSLGLGAVLALLLLYQGMTAWPDRYHRAANQALSDGHLAQAVQLWNDIVAGAPDHPLADDARRGLLLVELLRPLDAIHRAARAPKPDVAGFFRQAEAFVQGTEQFLQRYEAIDPWRPWAHKLANGLDDVGRACLAAAGTSAAHDTADLGLRAWRAKHHIDIRLGEAAPGSRPEHDHWAQLRRLRGETRFAASLASLGDRADALIAKGKSDRALGLLHALVERFPEQAARPTVARVGARLGAALRAQIRFEPRRVGLDRAAVGPGRLRSARGGPCPDARAAVVVIGNRCYGYDTQDGRALWRRRLDAPPAGTPVWVAHGESPVVALPGPKRLWLLHPGTGKTYGSAELGAPLGGTPLVVGGRIWVPVRHGLWEWDVASGVSRGVWRLPLRAPLRLRADPTGKRLVVAADAFAVCVLDLTRHALASVLLTLHRPGAMPAAPWLDGRGLIVFENMGLDFCRVRMGTPASDRPMALGRTGRRLDGWVWQVGHPVGSALPILTDQGVLYGLDLTHRAGPGAARRMRRQDLERFDKPRYAQVPVLAADPTQGVWANFAGLRPIRPGAAPGSLQPGSVLCRTCAAGPPVAHAGSAPMFVLFRPPPLVPQLVRLAPQRHDIEWSTPLAAAPPN